MKACVAVTKPRNVKTIVSLNPIMVTAQACAAGAG